jgi:hypothetical protein
MDRRPTSLPLDKTALLPRVDIMALLTVLGTRVPLLLGSNQPQAECLTFIFTVEHISDCVIDGGIEISLFSLAAYIQL